MLVYKNFFCSSRLFVYLEVRESQAYPPSRGCLPGTLPLKVNGNECSWSDLYTGRKVHRVNSRWQSIVASCCRSTLVTDNSVSLIFVCRCLCMTTSSGIHLCSCRWAFLKMSASIRAHTPHVTQHPPRMKMLSATPV